ncbi:MAG: asparagine synthase (glutamine-hydrolyzing) [Acidobacteriota bacterium]|nr:asparagine synthase (glutamine-hydrolyzing) [Acidobacteriota bacterium]MDH3783725.1 asparagine synthase (glutamine-hydrolyzing) [Acidobacteriota bacterium]
MCGLAGVFDSKPDSLVPPAELVARMRDTLVHRGPDDSGMYLGPGIGMGFRRLSIIDLAGGHQPIANEDESIWLTFNGEIYNFESLRKELSARGHEFKTKCDSEVIVHLYEEKGERCVDDLRGMFAFALYDQRRHRLFLARDRLGIKPLYYGMDSGRLLFGSEPKAILAALPGARRTLNHVAAALYFELHYVPDGHCAFEGMSRLPPGHRLVVEDDGSRLECYWEPKMPSGEEFECDETARNIRHALEESVRLRMVSDVPLGAFLSGGLDSAAVVGIMSRLSDRPIKTFTIGFDETSHDESTAARITAAFHRTDHHELIVQPDVIELLSDLVNAYDEPFADSSAIPTYLVSRFAREHVTVSMSGDGGDELFAGYHRYRKLRQLESLRGVPATLRRVAVRTLDLASASSGARRVRRALSRSLLSFPDDYFVGESFLSQEMREILRPLLEEQFVREPGRNLYLEHARDGDPIAAAQLIDMELYLPGCILTKVDRASMACSLEARVPLLDHHLVELVNRLPTETKLDGNVGKKILRKACADLYPPEIVGLRKQGFGVPLKQWFRGALNSMLMDTLRGKLCRDRGYYDPRLLDRLIDDHVSGRRDRSAMLYGLLMFELWAQRSVHGESA